MSNLFKEKTSILARTWALNVLLRAFTDSASKVRITEYEVRHLNEMLVHCVTPINNSFRAGVLEYLDKHKVEKAQIQKVLREMAEPTAKDVKEMQHAWKGEPVPLTVLQLIELLSAEYEGHKIPVGILECVPGLSEECAENGFDLSGMRVEKTHEALRTAAPELSVEGILAAIDKESEKKEGAAAGAVLREAFVQVFPKHPYEEGQLKRNVLRRHLQTVHNWADAASPSTPPSNKKRKVQTEP